MSNRRMTSLKIIDTDAFLDMPQTSQNLYFHLNGRADDDGFIANPKRISRMIGANEDDFNILVGKKFLIVFDDGICVIKHWRISNTIRKDRYKKTKYLEHRDSLFIKSNGAYTTNENNSSIPLPIGHFIVDDDMVDQTATTGRRKLSKVKLNKVKKEREKEMHGEFQNVKLTTEEFGKLIEKIGKKNTNVLIAELDGYIESKGKRYKSHYATILNWARRRVLEKDSGKVKVI